MKTIASIAAVGLGALFLTGCIHVTEDNYSDADMIARNTESAIRVCGEGNVQKVDEEGYSCKAER
jgi:PBP1b-binding outer membrane lipoprotein LpoB